MLKNKSYIGILKSGETESEIFSHLQIISPELFKRTEELRLQRSIESENRRVPLNTKGSTLLSGNVFCGHRGSRLVVTTNRKKYERIDGTISISKRTRYVCYNKTRHKHLCDGQTGYTSKKLDNIVDTVICTLFAGINDLPKEQIIEERYNQRIAEQHMAFTKAKAELQAVTTEVLEYEAEVIKIIRGESKLNQELLNKLYEEAKERAVGLEASIQQCEDVLKNSKQMKEKLSAQFQDIENRADMYTGCDMESKKMILSQVFSNIRVKRDYTVSIDLNASYEQLGFIVNDEKVSRLESTEDSTEYEKIANN